MMYFLHVDTEFPPHSREAKPINRSQCPPPTTTTTLSCPVCLACPSFLATTTVALALMDEMKQSMPCDETTYSTVVHGCSQTRDWKAAERLLKDMRREGLKPNEACYYALLAAASKAGELRLAEVLFKGMGDDGVAPDSHAFTTLFAGCGRFHDWRLALRLLESMRSEGVVPTTKNYAASLRACGRGEAEVAEVLLEMMRTQRVELDVVGRAAAVVAFGRGGRVDKALALMDDMRNNGPSPNRECACVRVRVEFSCLNLFGGSDAGADADSIGVFAFLPSSLIECRKPLHGCVLTSVI